MNFRPRARYKNLILVIFFLILITGFFVLISSKQNETVLRSTNISEKIISGKFNESLLKSDSEWERILTPEQYHILREAGTETPFTGKLNNEKRKGTYYSVGCDTPLFRSEQKYDSTTGWPSFWAPINESVLVLRREKADGDTRIEVLDTCGNHLGHVFDDGPQPTGKRYCMNSVALKFIPDDKEE